MKIKYIILLTITIISAYTGVSQPYVYGRIIKPVEIKEPKRFLNAYQLIKENERGVSFFEHKTKQTFAITVGNILLIEDVLAFNDLDKLSSLTVNCIDGSSRALLFYENKFNDYTKEFRNIFGDKYYLPKAVTPIPGAKLRTTKFRKLTDAEIDRNVNISTEPEYKNELGIFAYYDLNRKRYTVTYGEDVLAQDIELINTFDIGNIVEVYRNSSLDTLLSWKNGRIVFHEGDKETVLPKFPKKTELQQNDGRFKPPLTNKEDDTLNYQISIENTKSEKFPLIEKKEEEPVMEMGTKHEIVEVMPDFEGGLRALELFLKTNVKYPVLAKEIGIQGRVFVRFLVSETGEISDIKVTKSLYPSCDEEVVRVAKLMPKWIPGKVNGEPAPVYFVMPVLFRLK